MTLSLNEAWTNATNYIESLPDERQPNISLSFSRLENFRRKAVKPDQHIRYTCHISAKYKPGEGEDRQGYRFFAHNTFNVCPATAVNEAIAKLKEFLAPKKASIYNILD